MKAIVSDLVVVDGKLGLLHPDHAKVVGYPPNGSKFVKTLIDGITRWYAEDNIKSVYLVEFE